MASIKLKFKPSSCSGKEGVLYFQLIHNRTVRRIRTGYKIYSYEWDEVASQILLPAEENARRVYLLSLQEYIQAEKKLMEEITFSFLQRDRRFTADELVCAFSRRVREDKFFPFMQKEISRLQKLGKVRTAETYASALSSFRRFRENVDPGLSGFNSGLMQAYQAYLTRRRVSLNTVSFYMRILRAVYNRGVEEGITEQRYPFKHVYTGVGKTVKRAVPLSVIRKMKEMDLRASPSLDYARDLFLFSFYTRGMSFVDMAYLKKKDLKEGILSYRRRKTGQPLFVKWEKCMQQIVDKYPASASSPYLLPIISHPDKEERTQYKNSISSVNKNLKRLSRLIGVSIPLTTYVARHSWASIAKSKHIPLAVISEGMGHDSENTTRIYLASLDRSVVDAANSLILKNL